MAPREARQALKSARRLPGILLGSGAALIGALSLHVACGESTTDAGGTGATAGSAGDAAAGGSAGTGGTGSGGAGGRSGSAGAPGYDGGLWQPNGDPGWTSVPWVDCGAAYAKHPEHVVPPLIWQACEGGVAGCQRLKVNWIHEEGQPPLQVPFGDAVHVTSNGDFFVMWVITKVGTQKMKTMGVFAEAQTPIAAWSGPAACIPVLMEWSSKHICQTFGGEPPLRVGLVPLGANLNATPLKTFHSAADVPMACNESKLFALDLAYDLWVRDFETDAVHEIGWPTGSAFYPRVHGELALVQRASSNAQNDPILQGWLWVPPNSLTLLVDPSPQLTYDIRTDGATLVWTQATATDEYEWVPADIWLSPFATEPSSLQPKKLRQHPGASAGLSAARMGGGYYAAIQAQNGGPTPNSVDHRLHLYRLSDGRHWEVPRFEDVAPGAIPGTHTTPVEIISLDSKEVWYSTRSQTTGAGPWTIVRQRLDALGPGD